MPSPCQSGCPAGIDVPSYIALIGHKRYGEALDLIIEDNPFPSICGRACPHPCELECKRGEVDTPVAIMYLKRFVADLEINRAKNINPRPITRKEKIAVIGAGPAGLTAAHYLIHMGYAVTVMEALEKPGGMLLAGIPEYRLPRPVIQAEIDAIVALGVKLVTGKKVGRDISLQELREQGYSAFIMAIGAHSGKKLGIFGEDKYAGCVNSVEFLREINFGKITELKDRVVVVGGGNSAVDTARLAVRLGAPEVTIAYRRTREEMPAFEEEIEAALEEGVKLKYLVSPVSVKGSGHKLTGMECIRNKLGEADASGRRKPVPVEDSEFIIPCDIIVPAISQEPDLKGINDHQTTFDITRWNTFKVNANSLQTSIDDVFAAGDAVTGPATIIEAIAAGQRVAAAVDRYCSGESLDWNYKSVRPKRMIDELEISDSEMENLKREKMPCADVKKRTKSFTEVELGYDEQTCINEAKRCLRCDL
jgi:NADH-quinone oxidoreductase subunit F